MALRWWLFPHQIYRRFIGPNFFGGYFALFALIGLAVGVFTDALVGGDTEWLLRRLGLGLIPALLGASLVCFGACLILSNALQMCYSSIQPPVTKNKPGIAPPPMTDNPCRDKPPADPRQRQAWEIECR